MLPSRSSPCGLTQHRHLRSLAMAVLVPPQVADEHARLELAKRYRFDFRRLWMEHPRYATPRLRLYFHNCHTHTSMDRVRLDGVYISLCHYMRHGQSADPWHSVSFFSRLHSFPIFTTSTYSPSTLSPTIATSGSSRTVVCSCCWPMAKVLPVKSSTA